MDDAPVLLLGRRAFLIVCCRYGVSDNFVRLICKYLSTSSLSMMNSFFKTLMAYRALVFFSSANITLPKFPLPRTARKLKSSSPTFLLRAGGRDCCGDNDTA